MGWFQLDVVPLIVGTSTNDEEGEMITFRPVYP